MLHQRVAALLGHPRRNRCGALCFWIVEFRARQDQANVISSTKFCFSMNSRSCVKYFVQSHDKPHNLFSFILYVFSSKPRILCETFLKFKTFAFSDSMLCRCDRHVSSLGAALELRRAVRHQRVAPLLGHPWRNRCQLAFRTGC